MARTAKVERKTRETNIRAELKLDGTGQVEIQTGIGFFDHLLTSAMVHGFFQGNQCCCTAETALLAPI